MLRQLRAWGAKLSFAGLLASVFLALGMAQVVWADQTITGTSCNNNGRLWYGILERVWANNTERAQTNNGSGAGCTHFWVSIAAWWFPPGGNFVQYTHSYEKTGTGTGWLVADRFNSDSHFYVAAHTVQRRVEGQLPTPLYTLFSSNDAAHSTPNYFCSGTATGPVNCPYR